MPKNMGIVRPDRVLVIGTVDYYMKVEHKVWVNKIVGWGYNPASWLVYKEDGGLPT
jgi:hypothetical protein